jgi:prophage maintenance system killer protein
VPAPAPPGQSPAGSAIFVGLNGFEIEASQEDVLTTMFAAAAGQLTEAQLRDWVQSQLVKSV